VEIETEEWWIRKWQYLGTVFHERSTKHVNRFLNQVHSIR